MCSRADFAFDGIPRNPVRSGPMNTSATKFFVLFFIRPLFLSSLSTSYRSFLLL
jgi:hypothetical protein